MPKLCLLIDNDYNFNKLKDISFSIKLEIQYNIDNLSYKIKNLINITDLIVDYGLSTTIDLEEIKILTNL